MDRRIAKKSACAASPAADSFGRLAVGGHSGPFVVSGEIL
jgi:hypothetical protein